MILLENIGFIKHPLREENAINTFPLKHSVVAIFSSRAMIMLTGNFQTQINDIQQDTSHYFTPDQGRLHLGLRYLFTKRYVVSVYVDMDFVCLHGALFTNAA